MLNRGGVAQCGLESAAILIAKVAIGPGRGWPGGGSEAGEDVEFCRSGERRGGVEREGKLALFARSRSWVIDSDECGDVWVSAILPNETGVNIEIYCPGPDIVLRCDSRVEY